MDLQSETPPKSLLEQVLERPEIDVRITAESRNITNYRGRDTVGQPGYDLIKKFARAIVIILEKSDKGTPPRPYLGQGWKKTFESETFALLELQNFKALHEKYRLLLTNINPNTNWADRGLHLVASQVGMTTRCLIHGKNPDILKTEPIEEES